MRLPFHARDLARSFAAVSLVASAGIASVGSSCASAPEDRVVAPEEVPAEATVIAEVRPPPISGGTLIISKDGRFAYIADPDRDRFLAFDLETRTPRASIALAPGDEPGRLVEDAAGLVHVATRRGGDVVTIDPQAREIVARRRACAAPRGIAYDGERDDLIVACAGGELVTLGASLREHRRTSTYLEGDLRDVVITEGRVFVTTFRSAELLELDADRHVVSRRRPPAQAGLGSAVAWRTIVAPDGTIVMTHQRSTSSLLPPAPENAPPVYYGDGLCGASIVQSAATYFGPSGDVAQGVRTSSVLPVDIAVAPHTKAVAVASPATDSVQILLPPPASELSCLGDSSVVISGEPIAVAFTPDDLLVVLTREPSSIVLGTGGTQNRFYLGGDLRADSGHKLFHGDPEKAKPTIVCASCHPEGRDDGRVYLFEDGHPRRSMSLVGGLLSTAPFHWTGDMDSLGTLMDDVFVHRMGGKPQTPERLDAIASYVDQLPAVAVSAPADRYAVARGKALFEDESVACASCHSGPLHTNSTTVDVGTGGKLQVPPLVGLAHEGPFMHDGCAPSLRDRFTDPCGGGDAHGHTSQLTVEQIDDLVAYLETL